MSTEGGPDPHADDVETLSPAIATVEQTAVERSRRAADHAVRSIFELAALLDFLSEAIERYHAETPHPSGHWPHKGV